MARQLNINLSGAIANIIMYERNGQHYARTRPSKVRQSKATRSAAAQFAIANKISAALRAGLGIALPDRNKNELRSRLISPILRWVRSQKDPEKSVDLPFITGFQFNAETSIKDRLKKLPVIAWNRNEILLNFSLVPAKDILVPAGAIKVHFQVVATCFSAREPKKNAGNHIAEFSIDYSTTRTERIIEIPFALKKGELAVIMLTIRYDSKQKIVSDKRWLPSGIIGSCFMNDGPLT